MKLVLMFCVFSASFTKFSEGAADANCILACATTYSSAIASPTDQTAYCEATTAYLGCLTACGEDTTPYLEQIKNALDALGFACDLPKPDTGSGSGSGSRALPCGLFIVLGALLLVAYKTFDL